MNLQVHTQTHWAWGLAFRGEGHLKPETLECNMEILECFSLLLSRSAVDASDVSPDVAQLPKSRCRDPFLGCVGCLWGGGYRLWHRF